MGRASMVMTVVMAALFAGAGFMFFGPVGIAGGATAGVIVHLIGS